MNQHSSEDIRELFDGPESNAVVILLILKYPQILSGFWMIKESSRLGY